MIGETIAKNLIERYNPASILFCPYKEEMWDSMQTIYEYFYENCEENIAVSIMPIAYYTLSNGRINDRLMDNRVTWDVIHIRKEITTSEENNN